MYQINVWNKRATSSDRKAVINQLAQTIVSNKIKYLKNSKSQAKMESTSVPTIVIETKIWCNGIQYNTIVQIRPTQQVQHIMTQQGPAVEDISMECDW